MKNLILFFCIVFFPVFLIGQGGSQTPVGGLSYAPDSNYVIYSQLYKGRNGVATWTHKDSINWLGGVEYDNHVFLSQNGNNFTGKLGRFDKPFLDPWGAQNSLSSDTNLSFLAYQGEYTYTGPYNGVDEILTQKDTFFLDALPGANFSMINPTTASLRPFITDWQADGTTTPRKVYINAPQSRFFFTDAAALMFPIGMYDEESSLFFKARSFVQTGGRVANFFACPSVNVELDSFLTTGCFPLHVSYNSASNATGGTLSRKMNFKVKNLIFTDEQNSGDRRGVARYQLNAGIGMKDSLSSFSWVVGDVITQTMGAFNFELLGGNEVEKSSFHVKINSIKPVTATIPTEPLIILTASDTVRQSTIDVEIREAKSNKGILGIGFVGGGGTGTDLFRADSTNVNITLGQVTSTSGIDGYGINLRGFKLYRGSKINIHCDYCLMDGGIRLRDITIPEGTEINFSGVYEVRGNVPNVTIQGTNDLTGLSFKNATFVNDGVTEWINASAATIITGNSGIWTNSDSALNVTIQGNELWGFQYPGNTAYYDLQTVLDSMYNAFVSGSDGNGIISALPLGNVSINAASSNFDINTLSNLTFFGAGSASYRFNLYPNSSLPVLLEQTSAGDTAFVQLQGSLGRANIRATEDIYLDATTALYATPLEGSSTQMASARPNGEIIRREEAFFNAYFISDTIIIAASETEINSAFVDAISPSFTVLGDSIIYTGADTAYFDVGYYSEAEILESAIGTYLLELSCYKNGLKLFPSESWHRVYFTATETQPIESISKRLTTQLVNGDVLNIRQNGTTGASAALHNFSFTGQKIQ